MYNDNDSKPSKRNCITLPTKRPRSFICNKWYEINHWLERRISICPCPNTCFYNVFLFNWLLGISENMLNVGLFFTIRMVVNERHRHPTLGDLRYSIYPTNYTETFMYVVSGFLSFCGYKLSHKSHRFLDDHLCDRWTFLSHPVRTPHPFASMFYWNSCEIYVIVFIIPTVDHCWINSFIIQCCGIDCNYFLFCTLS